jgi:hypothetical protein
VVALQRAGEVIEVDSSANRVVRERLESRAGLFQPIIVAAAQHNPPDESVKTFLLEAFAQFDLLEPFERMRTALKFLEQQDPKYR